MSEHFIGLMSGTSMDAIDTAIVRIGKEGIHCLGTRAHPIPDGLGRAMRSIAHPDWRGGLDELARLDALLGIELGTATMELLRQEGMTPLDIRAIGSHGQTILHRPGDSPPTTLQIGCPHRLAQATGITVVADFRRRDLAAGGEGAPLVPACHEALFRTPTENRSVLNLGGIANLTVLPAAPERCTSGFDIGPANALMDAWIRQHHNRPCDMHGEWASSGTVIRPLLDRLLEDPFFAAAPPKSTGTQHFSLVWLAARMSGLEPLRPEDVQATLLELTAESIARSIRCHAPETRRLLICGGGIHNLALMRRLGQLLPECIMESTLNHGVDPDWVEAVAFAWLAHRTLAGQSGNLPAVTGAREPLILGAIIPGRPPRV